MITLNFVFSSLDRFQKEKFTQIFVHKYKAQTLLKRNENLTDLASPRTESKTASEPSTAPHQVFIPSQNRPSKRRNAQTQSF